jgi:hypothetical protein
MKDLITRLPETKQSRAYRAYRPYPFNRSLYLSPRIDTINGHQSTSDNMNQSESTHSPSVLYRDGGGWSGGNDRFRVVENVIKIKKSDGYPNIVPTEQQRVKMYDQFGNFSQHIQLYNTDPVFQLWMNKIAPYLADWVLDKRNDRAWLFLSFSLLLY